MTDERLRIGILGAGTIAGVHAANLDQIPEARLVAVADLDVGRASWLAGPRDAAVLGGIDDLLGFDDLDAVLVCLPPFATPGVVVRLAGRGLHVYAEKPVGLRLKDALADLAAVGAAGVVAASGYMWQASPIVAEARRRLAGRQIGLIQGTVITAAPPPPWWRNKARSGGMIVELTTHVIDLVRLFGGEPRRVACTGNRLLLGDPDGSVDDVAAATIEFASGAVGSLALTCGTTGGRWTVDLVAADRHLNLNFFPERLTGTEEGAPLDYAVEPPPGIAPHGFSGSASWYLSLRRFVQAALAGEPDAVAAGFEDGVQTLALSLACEESMSLGGVSVEVASIT